MQNPQKILFILAFAFSFASCQKCMECTNEKLLNNQEGEIVYEMEICEDDFDSKEDMEFYIEMVEEDDGVRCYRNLW